MLTLNRCVQIYIYVYVYIYIYTYIYIYIGIMHIWYNHEYIQHVLCNIYIYTHTEVSHRWWRLPSGYIINNAEPILFWARARSRSEPQRRVTRLLQIPHSSGACWTVTEVTAVLLLLLLLLLTIIIIRRRRRIIIIINIIMIIIIRIGAPRKCRANLDGCSRHTRIIMALACFNAYIGSLRHRNNRRMRLSVYAAVKRARRAIWHELSDCKNSARARRRFIGQIISKEKMVPHSWHDGKPILHIAENAVKKQH